MVTTSESLQYLYPTSDPFHDYSVSHRDGSFEITRWNESKLGPQPTPEQLAAVTQAQVDAARLAKLRALAKQFQDDQQAQNVALRVTVKLLVDELNVLRQWLTSFKSETASATSLADLKTRVATLPNTPNRTYAQAKTAINTLIDGE